MPAHSPASAPGFVVSGVHAMPADALDVRVDPWGRRLCDAPRSKGRGPCHGPAITGQTKCRMHIGKSAEQLRRETRELILDAALEALGVNVELLRDDETPPAVRAQIGRDLLDRAGFDAKTRVEISNESDVDRDIERLVAELAARAEGAATSEAES